MKKIALLLILFLTGCGYEIIYSKNEQSKLEFKKIILEGDNTINNQIINSLNIKTNVSSSEELRLITDYKIVNTSKNSKGQIITYRSSINTNLIIRNEKKNIINKNFSNEFTYNNQNNKFELTEYQNTIRENLTKELTEKIILFLKIK